RSPSLNRGGRAGKCRSAADFSISERLESLTLLNSRTDRTRSTSVQSHGHIPNYNTYFAMCRLCQFDICQNPASFRRQAHLMADAERPMFTLAELESVMPLVRASVPPTPQYA